MTETEPKPVIQLVRAVLQTQKFRWVFPVVAGTSLEVIWSELRNRFANGPYAEVIGDPNSKLEYPDGPYQGTFVPSDPPPIGWNGPWSPQAVPTAPVAGPPPGATGPVAPPTPLPRHPREPQPGPQLAVYELEGMLMQWRARHGLTSAEVYLYLSSALSRHASSLVELERRGAQGAPRA